MIVQKVQEIIVKKFIDRRNVTPKSMLKADLKFDDLDIACLLLFLERDYSVRLPEKICDEAGDVSVQFVAGILERELIKKNAPQHIAQKLK